jgi:hypothetical protein
MHCVITFLAAEGNKTANIFSQNESVFGDVLI